MDTEDLVEQIYEAAVVPSYWGLALARLAKRADAVGAVLFMVDEGQLRWIASPEVSERMRLFVEAGWPLRNTRTPRMLALNHQGFIQDLDVYSSIEEIAADPMYRDFLYPHGLGVAAGTFVQLSTGGTLVFNIERSRERGPFERPVIADLDSLRPHLARSSFISARINQERARSSTIILEQLGIPACALQLDSRVIAANSLFVKHDYFVSWSANDRVVFRDSGCQHFFELALTRFSHGDIQGSFSYPLRPGPEHSGAILHILPICGQARDIFEKTIALAVLVPLTAPGAPPIELLEGLFDLSPAEAAVARKIALGKTVSEISREQQRSQETIRTHVKNILQKTGCKRQADFIRITSNAGLGKAE